MDSMSSGPASNWRESTGPAEGAESAGPRWRSGGGPARPAHRRWLVFVTLGWIGFLLVCATLTWLATWLLPPRPGCLVLIGAGYEDNLALPLNVAGNSGLVRLVDYSRDKQDSAGLYRVQM